MNGNEVAAALVKHLIEVAKDRPLNGYAYITGYIESKLGMVLARIAYNDPDLYKRIVEDHFPEIKEVVKNG
jgi:hypothetical protein